MAECNRAAHDGRPPGDLPGGKMPCGIPTGGTASSFSADWNSRISSLAGVRSSYDTSAIACGALVTLLRRGIRLAMNSAKPGKSVQSRERGRLDSPPKPFMRWAT